MQDAMKPSGPAMAPTPAQWAIATEDPAFQALVQAKIAIILPMLAIYLGTYIGTTILCGFLPGLAGTKVLGGVNLGYLLIGLNYLLSWTLAILYVRVANRRFDPLAAKARAVAPGAMP